VLSTIGSYVLAIGFFVVAINLIMSFFRGRRAPANPWGGTTLEWTCSSPPPHDNFAVTPEVREVYDFTGLEYDAKIGGYVRRP
jgi:cytochrome c oxidase subunit 1